MSHEITTAEETHNARRETSSPADPGVMRRIAYRARLARALAAAGDDRTAVAVTRGGRIVVRIDNVEVTSDIAWGLEYDWNIDNATVDAAVRHARRSVAAASHAAPGSADNAALDRTSPYLLLATLHDCADCNVAHAYQCASWARDAGR